MPLTGLPCLVSLRSWPDHFPASPPTENPFLDHGTDLSSSRWPGPGRNCFAGDRHIDRHPFSAVQRVASKHPGLRRDQADRKSVVLGKRVSVSVDLGGRRIIKKKN